MAEKVFISYNHGRAQWVRQYLAPILTAAGFQVLADYLEFKAGKALIGQMDATQDAADRQILVIDQAYLKSKHCCHELARALAHSRYPSDRIIPIRAEPVDLPDEIRSSLYIALEGMPGDAAGWRLLAKTLGFAWDPHAWLRARDRIRQCLEVNKSVNLVTSEGSCWRQLIQHLEDDEDLGLSSFDLHKGHGSKRNATVRAMLRAAGLDDHIAVADEDLIHFSEQLDAQEQVIRQAWLHFHAVKKRPAFDYDFFCTIRTHIMDERKLVVLLQSNQPMSGFIETNHQLSALPLETVHL